MRDLIKRMLARPEAVARLTAGRGPRLVVLMYHDLRADDDFDNWLRVGVSDFDAQLGELARLGRFVGPEEAARPGSLDPDHLHFMLTFDDGYVGNLELALPLLEKHRAPALVFVSTGPMQDQELFWSDVVVTAVQGAGLGELDLGAFGLGRFRFRAGGAGRWDDIQGLLTALKEQGDEDDTRVAAVLDHLRREHGQELEDHGRRFRPLRAEEVTRLGSNPWVTIGSHGHHHRLLTRLPDAELTASLDTSRRLLEELSGKPVREIAYPNGNCDARVRAAAAAAGYERGYLVRPGIVGGATPDLERPRLGVGGVGPAWLPRYRLARLLLQGPAGGAGR